MLSLVKIGTKISVGRKPASEHVLYFLREKLRHTKQFIQRNNIPRLSPNGRSSRIPSPITTPTPLTNIVDTLHLHPLQISLSNPLTIPVSFRVETRGTFAINPSPSRNRLSRVQPSSSTKVNHGNATNYSSDTVDGGKTDGEQTLPPQNTAVPDKGEKNTATGTSGGNARRPSCRETKKLQQRTNPEDKQTAPTIECGEIRIADRSGEGTRKKLENSRTRMTSTGLVKLLPGQNFQLEVVFLPAMAPTHGTAGIFQSSFAPGSEVTWWYHPCVVGRNFVVSEGFTECSLRH